MGMYKTKVTRLMRRPTRTQPKPKGKGGKRNGPPQKPGPIGRK